MKMEIETRSIVDGIDHLITIPAFNWDNMLAKIPIVELYASTKTQFGRSPLIHVAEKLTEYIKKRDTVLITTGFYIIAGETLESDGPVGAATIARALDLGLNAAPIILIREDFVENMKTICTAAGLSVCKSEKIRDGSHRVSVEGFPMEGSNGKCESLMRTLNPSALVSVECPDRNSRGIFHSAKGYDITSFQSKFPDLFDLAFNSKVFTVGIGDFGNEIGMASLSSAFQKLIPSHRSCRCGCGDGIIGSTKTNASIIANISNWGAYGLEAALALLLEDPEIMHDVSIERRILEETARVGFLDAVTGLVEPSVDGASTEINVNLVSLLCSLVNLHTSRSFKQFFG